MLLPVDTEIRGQIVIVESMNFDAIYSTVLTVRLFDILSSDAVLCCRALKEEKYAARRAILPMLQAEEDER